MRDLPQPPHHVPKEHGQSNQHFTSGLHTPPRHEIYPTPSNRNGKKSKACRYHQVNKPPSPRGLFCSLLADGTTERRPSKGPIQLRSMLHG
ncbi:hypothetical protein BO99DRAFT_68616 [Aspergillus violaceofuscus CBS 115571]|uniref:Uncharacterized protein n=1 Tax=Aspergillus violaceofuscus (strain CBS 115571) TaxID=1450538 RepID=A0A2V5HAS2_ASPV1|nr:hypothetical protein BO99DRAFT_68616 [Aspergillus violaceofuscus CBS 115571]